MATLTNNEVKNILESHHTGVVLLMRGNADSCPGTDAIIVQQPVLFAMNGCRSCMMYALRSAFERYPHFKTVVVDALNTKFNP